MLVIASTTTNNEGEGEGEGGLLCICSAFFVTLCVDECEGYVLFLCSTYATCHTIYINTAGEDRRRV